jgi:outer membrane protein
MRWEARNVSVWFQRDGRVALAVLAILVLLGWGTHGWAAQAAVRIGIVDLQEVLNKSQKGLAVKQKLDQERAVRQKDLDGKQQEVMKLQAEFEKQAPLLSEQAKREKSEAIQRKTRDAVRIAEDANRDFDKRVREAELEVSREILGVVQEYGKDQGFTLVLERSMVVFGASVVDITSEIIKRYDSKQQ